jgi:transposase
MAGVTTVQLEKRVVRELRGIRKYPRQTYNEIISDLIKKTRVSKKGSGLGAFIQEGQRAKMRELWDNKEDEAWDAKLEQLADSLEDLLKQVKVLEKEGTYPPESRFRKRSLFRLDRALENVRKGNVSHYRTFEEFAKEVS